MELAKATIICRVDCQRRESWRGGERERRKEGSGGEGEKRRERGKEKVRERERREREGGRVFWRSAGASPESLAEY